MSVAPNAVDGRAELEGMEERDGTIELRLRAALHEVAKSRCLFWAVACSWSCVARRSRSSSMAAAGWQGC